MQDGKYDKHGRKEWLLEHHSIWRMDSPKSSKCFSAANRSFFFSLSFFGIDHLGIARGTINSGNGAKPVGKGDGGKTRVLSPHCARQREQGKAQAAARQSRRDKSGPDRSKAGFS